MNDPSMAIAKNQLGKHLLHTIEQTIIKARPGANVTRMISFAYTPKEKIILAREIWCYLVHQAGGLNKVILMNLYTLSSQRRSRYLNIHYSTSERLHMGKVAFPLVTGASGGEFNLENIIEPAILNRLRSTVSTSLEQAAEVLAPEDTFWTTLENQELLAPEYLLEVAEII